MKIPIAIIPHRYLRNHSHIVRNRVCWGDMRRCDISCASSLHPYHQYQYCSTWVKGKGRVGKGSERQERDIHQRNKPRRLDRRRLLRGLQRRRRIYQQYQHCHVGWDLGPGEERGGTVLDRGRCFPRLFGQFVCLYCIVYWIQCMEIPPRPCETGSLIFRQVQLDMECCWICKVQGYTEYVVTLWLQSRV